MTQHCGFIALLGKPNAGKSTLLNACIGQKIAGVSKRPQTTRNRILGVRTDGNNQLIFLDTPGMHKMKNSKRINQMMNKEAWGVMNEADVVCYLIDSKLGVSEEDESHLKSLLTQTELPLFILCSKSDVCKKHKTNETETQIVQLIVQFKKNLEVTAKLMGDKPLQISAKRPEDVELFCNTIAKELPAGPWHFEEDDLTDRPQTFVVAEMIREQVFRQLGDELPYGSSVIIEKLEDTPKIVKILATIIVARKTHKAMIIGKQGSRIKAIGMEARKTLEKHFDNQVFLELYVKVQENWIDNDELITQFEGLT